MFEVLWNDEVRRGLSWCKPLRSTIKVVQLNERVKSKTEPSLLIFLLVLHLHLL